MRQKKEKTLIPYGKSGKKCRKRPFSGVPQDPGKGVFFGLCLGSLKSGIAGFMA